MTRGASFVWCGHQYHDLSASSHQINKPIFQSHLQVPTLKSYFTYKKETAKAMTTVALLSSAATAAAPSTISLRCTSAALPPLSSVSLIRASRRRSGLICCEVAVKSESSISIGGDSSEEEDELKRKLEVVGSRVRVTTPLKLYHVPKVPEVELKPGTEGVIKQYVGFWKGTRISANLPYKVEFQIEIEGLGPVKFFAHLKEDEFEFV